MSSPTDDITGVDGDGEREMCPCRMPITKDDYKKISNRMPPRLSTQILTECLGISNPWFPEFEPHRYNALVTWSNKQTIEVTRAILYDKLAKAVHMEICESSDWFDFLIPVQCKNHYSSIVEMQNICTTDDCPCSMEVSERDYSKISRGMPPRMWKHICRECLGISDADLYKAEYKNWFQSIESSICDALITWSHAQGVGVTKARLYGQFVKARNMGLCESTEWFDFLIPTDCPCHVPSFRTEIRRPDRIKLGILKECMVRLLSNSLQIHIMLISFMVKLCYETLQYEVTNINIFLQFACAFTTLFCLMHSVLGWIELNSKLSIVYLLSGVIHFITLLTVGSHRLGYYLNMALIQFPLLWIKAENIPTLLVTRQQLTAVYGMYRPQMFWSEIFLSFITWSVSGVMIACLVRLCFDLNSTSEFYISLCTDIVIVCVWLSTLDQDSLDICQHLTSTFKSGKIALCTCSDTCRIKWLLIAMYIVGNYCILHSLIIDYSLDGSNPYVIRDDTDLLTACICTLVILNIQSIFYFRAEEKRSRGWELLTFLLLYMINAGILGYRSLKCSQCVLNAGEVTDQINNIIFQALFPFKGYSPYDVYLCPGPGVNTTVLPLNTTNVPLNQTVLPLNTTDIPLNVTNLTVT